MGKIILFSDGASKGNPGPGGWGAIVVGHGHAVELGGRESHTTNNRMEMRAALEALLYAARFPRTPVVVHTDSSYLINGITKWVKGWKAKGWVTAGGKEVLNRDLWERLSDATEKLSHVEWKHVGGHVGIPGNERVDEIASNFAEGKKVVLHDGAHDGYSIDVHDLLHDAAKGHAKKRSSSARSKGKAYSYISELGGVVKVHATWVECEARTKGKRARFKKAMTAVEEAQIIKNFSSR